MGDTERQNMGVRGDGGRQIGGCNRISLANSLGNLLCQRRKQFNGLFGNFAGKYLLNVRGNVGDHPLIIRRNSPQFCRRQAALLELGNDSDQLAGVDEFAIVFNAQRIAPVKSLQNLRDDLVLRQFIRWLTISAVKKIFPVLIDNLRAEAVKSVNGDFISVLADDLAEALAHVGGAALGKRQAQNTVWQRVGLAQNLGGAHTQQLSLARARPGDHQERTVNIIDRLALIGVQLGVASLKIHITILLHNAGVGEKLLIK